MKIEVTTKHFRESTMYGDNENCPLAMAIKDMFPKDTSIDVGGWTAGIGKENYKISDNWANISFDIDEMISKAKNGEEISTIIVELISY